MLRAVLPVALALRVPAAVIVPLPLVDIAPEVVMASPAVAGCRVVPPRDQ